MTRTFIKISMFSILLSLSLERLNAASTLNQEPTALIQEVCTFMDKAQQCERYWQEINHSLFKKYTSSFPTRWFNKKWHTETPLKADLAHALFDKLAHFLGVIEGQTRTVIEQDWNALKRECDAILVSCAIPSAVERHWLKYALGTLTIGALYLKTKHSLGKQTLFELSPDSPSLKDSISRIPNSVNGPDRFVSEYRLSQQAGQQFIEVSKEYADDVKAFLNQQHINFTERTPFLSDLSTHIYNPDGKTHIEQWMQEHCVKPCKNLYEILFKDKQQGSALELLGSADTTNAHVKEQLNTFLSKEIQRALDCPDPGIRDCMIQALKSRKIEDLDLGAKQEIRLQFLFYLCSNGHQKLKEYARFIAHKTATEVAPTVGGFLLGKAPVDNSSYDLIFETLAGVGLEKLIQGNAILNAFRDVAEAQRLTLAMMSAVPVAVIGYLTYKGTKSLTHRIAKRSFIKPLKQDLLSLQITLNSHRYEEALGTHTRGLCRYWTTRLGSYLKKLSSSERPRYVMYLEQLEKSSLTADQKIQTIECMFKEFSFLR